MDRDSTTLLLLALMIFGGTVGTRHLSNAKDKSQEVDKTREPGAEASGYGSPATAPVDLIGRFFESRDPTKPAAGASRGAKLWWPDGAKLSVEITRPGSEQSDLADALPNLRKLRRLSKDKKVDVDFMIATVPDPIDSHAGWEADSIIDAIQRAFEDEGFVLDRFYFPWQGYARKPADPSKLDLPLHSRYPGVLLFRSGTVVPSPPDKELQAVKFQKRKLYAVLLVGETPTRGVHKIALVRALDVVAAWKAPDRPSKLRSLFVRVLEAELALARNAVAVWEAPDRATEPRSLFVHVLKTVLTRATDMVAAWKPSRKDWPLQCRILGPTFSGSSMSLRDALEEWVSGKAGIEKIKAHKWASIEFQIVSGSAQDLRNKPTLQFDFPPKGLQAHRWRAPAVHSTFHGATLPSIAFNKCVFGNYLERRNNVDRRQIALLLEANTVYGENANKGSNKPTRDDPENNSESDDSEWKLGEGAPEQQPITLHYPMQIGRLRAAYQRNRTLVPDELRAAQETRENLELKLEENPAANDLLPALSQNAETSVAAVMKDMLAALGRSGIRYVGIIGTDPMDVLFLARLVHQSCPDAQLFTTDGDLLFTQDAYRLYTDGMLVFSPYPLFLKSQLWIPHAPDQQERRQFSDCRAEGAFNASRRLLAPQGTFEGVDYGAPFDVTSRKPAAWCLVVSNGSLWPVECYPWRNSENPPDGYNDAVRQLIEGDYLSRLRKTPPDKKDPESLKEWNVRLRSQAGELWKEESHRYHFHVDETDPDAAYVFEDPDPVPGDGHERPRAHLAELALGLDGFLGFVSLLLSAFSLLNCVQYFAHGWPFLCNGVLVRWSLFYAPFSSERRGVVAQVSCYRFYFLVMLWLSQLVVMSPLLAGAYFCIDWSNGLHPRHKCILVIELSALFVLTCVLFIESLGVWGAATKKDPLHEKTEGLTGALLWPLLLGLLLVAATVCMLSWLCDMCWPSAPFWFIVIATVLPASFLVVGGVPALYSYIATLESKWAVRLVFFSALPAACVFVCLCGLLWLVCLAAFLAVAVPLVIGKWVVNRALAPWPDKTKQQWVLIIGGAIVLIGLFDLAAIAYFARRWETDPHPTEAVRLAMYTERAANLASGISPILPAVCVFGGIAVVAVCHLRRLRWLCWRPIKSPVPKSESLELASIRQQIEELSKTLRHPPIAWFGWLPMSLVVSVAALLVFAWPRETFESDRFKWFVQFGLVGLLGVITATWLQTLAVWDCLRQLLHRLAWHPMGTAYARLPGAFKRKFRAQLFLAVPTNIESELPLQQWQYLKDEVSKLAKKGGASQRILSLNLHAQMTGWIDSPAHKALDKLLGSEATLAAQRCNGPPGKDELKYRESIAWWSRKRSCFLAGWLEDWWETRRERNRLPREKEKSTPPTGADLEDRLCEKAEEFVAIQVALVVRSVLAHLKNYLGTSVAAVLLLLGMLNSYPFQPHRMLFVLAWTIGMFIVGTALWIFVVCNRDEALSRLSGLHPNKIDWDQQFILSVFSYGVVPVLVLLSMQFPEFGSHLYSPLEFVSKVLK